MVLSLGGGRGLGLGDEIDDLIAANDWSDSGPPVTVTPLYSSPQAAAPAPVVSQGDSFWGTLGKSLLGSGLATTAAVIANQSGAKTPQQQAALIAAQQAQAAAAQRQMLTILGVVGGVVVVGALLLRRRREA